MFKTYKELIDAASFKGAIEFEERKAVKAYYKGEEIPLPMFNTVIIPGEYVGEFMSKGLLEYAKLFEGIIKFGEAKRLPVVEGREFYTYALHHGHDYGHHCEPCITGLLIEAKYLEERREETMSRDLDLYKILELWENFKAPQTGGRVPDTINNEQKLEEKIIKIRI